MTRLVDIRSEELSRLRLGGGPWLLVEPPFAPAVTGLDALVFDLQRQGHRVLIAHPERCPAFHRDPGMLREFVNEGILTSITAGSLVGRFGGEVRRFALALAREGLIHNVTSDTHDTVNRPPGVAAELRQAGLEPLADWLTEQVPAAILSGAEIPPQPRGRAPRPRTSASTVVAPAALRTSTPGSRCRARRARTRRAAPAPRVRRSRAVDHAGDLDRRGGDHLDVHALLGEHREHLRRDARVRAHAGADDRDLAHLLMRVSSTNASPASGCSAALRDAQILVGER